MNGLSDSIFQKNWDFSAIPSEELEACLHYELARETKMFAETSETYLNQVKRNSDDQIATHCEMISQSFRCAYLLKSLNSEFDLAKKSWCELPQNLRISAAKEFSQRSAFEHANLYDLASYEFAKQKTGFTAGNPGGSLHFKDGSELVLIRIDWSQPASAIKQQCKNWLLQKCQEKNAIEKTGRPKDEPKALLRGLGAMRLLGRYEFTNAIKIVGRLKPENYVSGGCTYPYTGTIDSKGVYSGFTAWRTGRQSTVNYFCRIFPCEDQKQVPLSFRKRAAKIKT